MSDDLDPVRGVLSGIGISVALFLTLLAMFALLTGCGATRQESSREVQVEQTTTRTGPIVAETPIGPVQVQPTTVYVERKQTTTGQVSSRTEFEAPMVSAAVSAAAPALGLGGPVAGIGGLLFGAWRMFKERQAVGACRAIVDGVEEWKEKASPAEQKDLLTKLSGKMDASHKQLIRKVKA